MLSIVDLDMSWLEFFGIAKPPVGEALHRSALNDDPARPCFAASPEPERRFP